MDDYKEIFDFFEYITVILDVTKRNCVGLEGILSKANLKPLPKITYLNDEEIRKNLAPLMTDSRIYRCFKVVAQGLLLTMQEEQNEAATKVYKHSTTFVAYVQQFRKTNFFHNRILDEILRSFVAELLKILKNRDHAQYRQKTSMLNCIVQIMSDLVKYHEFIDIILKEFLKELKEFLALDRVNQPRKIYYVFDIVYVLDVATKQQFHPQNKLDNNSDIIIDNVKTVLQEIKTLQTSSAIDHLIDKILNVALNSKCFT